MILIESVKMELVSPFKGFAVVLTDTNAPPPIIEAVVLERSLTSYKNKICIKLIFNFNTAASFLPKIYFIK